MAASSRTITDGNVIFALGMRRILNGYGALAPIMRIRRVSDNAEINLITGDQTRHCTNMLWCLNAPDVLVVDDGTKRSATDWAGSGVEIRVSKWYNQANRSPVTVIRYPHRRRIPAMP